jgi:dephospho-CoA kinase
VISCRTELQTQRLCQRLDIGTDEALKWINGQMPLKQKELYADTVLANNGTINEFQHLVEQEWNKLAGKT